MTVAVVKNMGASVRQRLLNHGKTTGKPFAEVLQYYAMERFLYRLSVSPHAEKFLLKGALLLTAWHAPISRPTMDIDLLGRTDNGIDFIVRTVFTGSVDAARVHMQIDIGFGDVVTPGPELLSYPTILDFPPPVLSGYSRETVMAEKLQALTQLRMSNTRMKDYFDLWLLSRQPELNKITLRKAIQRTFENRKMDVEVDPIGLSATFGTDPAKQVQWIAFLKRSAITEAPTSLAELVEVLRVFFAPILIKLDKVGVSL
jgi:hypothetical protein